MSLWLSEEELIERTGFKQKAKQCLELARQRVRFTVRADGFPLVDRSQFDLTPKGARREPDYSHITRN